MSELKQAYPVFFGVEYRRYFPPNYAPKDASEEKALKEFLKFKGNPNYIKRELGCDKTTPSLTLDSSEEISGIFSSKGDLTKKEVRELNKKIKDLDHSSRTTVISFSGEIEKIIDNRVVANEVLNNTINKYFRRAGFDPKNMFWYGAYHNDTKNRHIHLSFFELEPKRINSKGELVYRQYPDLKINENANEFFKSEIYAWTMKNENKEFLNNRNELLNNLISSFDKKDLLNLAEKIGGKILTDDYTPSYFKLDKKDKKKVNEFINKIMFSNPKARESWNKFLEQLNDIEEEALLLDPKKKNKKLVHYKQNAIDSLYKSVGNEAVKLIKLGKEHGELKQKLFKEKGAFRTRAYFKNKTNNPFEIRHNEIERRESAKRFYEALHQIEDGIINYPYFEEGYKSLEETVADETDYSEFYEKEDD